MPKDRDISQRTFGFISFSFLAHLGLIAAAFLIPNVLKESASGSKTETYLVDSPASASLGESAQALPEPQPVQALPVEPPAKVVSIPVDHSSAIVVAKNEIKPAKELPAKKVVTPAREKAVTATKKVLALPAKKAAAVKAAPKVETVVDSDTEINQALENSRAIEASEEAPEVAADIEVPELNEQAQQQDEQAQGDASEIAEEPAVESATTLQTEEAAEVTPAGPVPAAKPVPVVQAAPVQQQPLIAPINRGAQFSRPSGQVGGLGTVGAAAPTTSGTGTDGNGSGAAGAIRDADSLREQAGNAMPTYAYEDQRSGRQGIVVFDAMVTKDGSVQAIQMKQSSGHSSLDASAYEAFRKHRYLPGQEGAVRKKFQFVLTGEQEAKSRLRRR